MRLASDTLDRWNTRVRVCKAGTGERHRFLDLRLVKLVCSALNTVHVERL